MAEKQKLHVNLSSLISHARLKMGYATLKELYRDKKPKIEYQTWLNAESGRRVPSTAVVTAIAKTLEIDRQSIILAYCRDKFSDDESQKALEALSVSSFVNIDALLDAEQHNRTREYIFSDEEIFAMKKDPRLRLFLTYTYDKNRVTTFSKLSSFFNETEEETKSVVQTLVKMGLVEVHGEEIKKVHEHTCIPETKNNFDLRKMLLIKSLEKTVRPDSYISNFHITMTDESYKRVLAFFDFIDANLIKFNETDTKKSDTSRFQIAITGNRLSRDDTPDDCGN